MTPTLSVDPVHVISRLFGDRGVDVKPVGTDGGVVSPVGLGLAVGLAVGDAVGEEVGEGDALGDELGDGDADVVGDGFASGVTSPVMVHDSTQVCGSAPGTILQSCVDGAALITAVEAGDANARPAPPTTMPTSKHTRPTA